MNCHEIQQFLDETGPEALSAAERRRVDSHLESCADCAQIWDAEIGFRMDPLPPVPAGLDEACSRMFAAGVARRTGRSLSRPILLSGLLVVGAAAAAFIGSQWWRSDDVTAEAGSTLVESAVGVVPAQDGTTGVAGALATGVAETTAPGDTAPGDARLIIAVTHVRHGNESAESRQFGDWFYAAVLDELRRVSDVVVIEHAPSDTSSPPPASADTDSVPLLPQPVGPTPEFRSPWGQALTDANRDDAAAYRAIVASLTPDAATSVHYDMQFGIGARVVGDAAGFTLASAGDDGSYGARNASRRLRPGVFANPDLAAEFAEDAVERLQIEELIPNERMFAEYEERLLDSALTIAARYDALNRAETLERRLRDPEVTERFVDAALALASESNMAEVRERVFSSLRNVEDSRLIQPLSDALLYDDDTAVRLQAAETLGGYRADDLARAALESAAQLDPSPEVRRVARWQALDDAGRSALIGTIVRDESLSDSDRLESLIMASRNVEKISDLGTGLVVDELTARTIVTLLSRTDDPARRRSVLLGLVQTPSESLVPLLIERMQNEPEGSVRWVAAAGLGEHLAVPGVRTALETAATVDPAEEVRSAAARALNDTEAGPNQN